MSGKNTRGRPYQARGGSAPPLGSPRSPTTNAGGSKSKTLSPAQILENMAIKDMSSDECFDFISHHVPYMKTFKSSWRIPGSMFVDLRPSQFEPQFRSELPFIPRSAAVEVFRAVQAKFSREWAATGSSNDPSITAERATEWANCPAPSQAVSFQASAADDHHGGGDLPPNGQPISALPSQVPQQRLLPQASSVNQLHIPPPPPFNTSHGGGFVTPPPSSSGKKFAFGRAAVPLSLHQQLLFSPLLNTGQALSSQPDSAGVRHQAGAAPLSHSQGAAPLSHFQGPAPSGQSNQSSDVRRPPGIGVPVSHHQMASDESVYRPAINESLPLQQVHMDHSGKVFMPWEIEALNRPPKPEDPDMMPGFKRLSISSLIEKAKQIRIQNKDTVAPPTHFDKVTYPVMAHFSVDDFLTTRQAFYVATRKSTASCLFTEFKFCMTESCRTSCMRQFSLDDEQFLEINDGKLLSWLGMFFGPKNKSDAIDRLEKIRFPSHRDETDSQAEFVDKLSDCSYEFEMSINDIANTHRTWSVDRTALTSGELTLKEVMELWRRKFAKQESSVFSVQLKTCRTFMDRDKDGLFNDIVLKLHNHFSAIDADVKTGKIAYSTQPTKPKPKRFQSQKTSQGGSGGGVAVGGGGDDGNGGGWPPRRSSEFQNKRPRPQESSTNKRPAFSGRITKGKDRCVSCGSNTNHWGIGIAGCPLKGTKFDANKNGHVWKDSDQEKTVLIPKDDYEKLVKSNPAIFKKQAEAKTVWKKDRHDSRISALEAGNPVSSSEDEDSGLNSDEQALADELHDNDSDASVNSDLCAVSALAAARLESGSQIVAQENLPQFFGVVQIIDDQDVEHLAKALIDPGGTMNIISSKFRDMCCLETRKVNIKFFQGDTFQRSAKELSRCRFSLKHNILGFVNHVEWFAVADMGYDVLLGRKFSKDNGFTRFEELLVPWQSVSDHGDLAISNIDALSADIDSNINFQLMIKFDRAIAATGEAKYKRKPKTMRCIMPASSNVNMINPSSLTSSNSLSNMLVLQSDILNGRERKLLQFALLGHEHMQQSHQDWFELDDSVPIGHIVMSTALSDKMNANVVGRRYPALPNPVVYEAPKLSAITATATDPSTTKPTSDAAASYVEALHVNRQVQRRPRIHLAQSFLPTTSDNVAIARFTTADSLTRHSAPALINDVAAHNVIARKILTNQPAKVKTFQTKTVAGIELVLLEFSLSCSKRQDSLIRFFEWFRIEDQDVNNSIIIKGIFDNDRLHASDMRAAQHFSASANTKSQLNRDTVSLDELRASFRVAAPANQLHVSYHPVQHYRLQRDANKPPITEQDLHHTSYLGNNNRERRKFLNKIGQQAQLAAVIARKRKVIQDMLNMLPTGHPEEASTASLCFETVLDEMAEANLHAKLAAIAAESETSTASTTNWAGNADFTAGQYVIISNAVKQPELNGLRVRLYDKTSDELTWRIRMLGKNNGIWRCHERFMKPIPSSEQGQARPHSSDAGFLDVAIDETGQPTGELPQLAHRQFGDEYSAALTARILELKAKYPQVFTKDVTEPCDFEEMDIKLIPNAVLPSKSRYYRNTPKMKQEVQRQIQEQLDWKAIRKAETAHCSDILLVKRPHMPGHWRFVINFQKLNDATVPEQLIMPDPVSQHSRLAGNCIFGAFDLSSYFRQLRLKESCQYLTGFASDSGTYVHTRVPMGVRNAPAFAQRVLQEAFANDPVLGPLGIKNYFDDIPFGAKSEDEFIQIMTAMLEFFAKWKLKVNPEKSVFGVKSITHVGFVVSKEGVSIDPERNRDISELASPKSIRKVQSTLGILNYVRNFVPDFSFKAKCLTDKLSAQPSAFSRKRSLTEADSSKVETKRTAPVAPPFVWTPQDEIDFQALKAAVLAAPLLAQLDYAKQIYIRCDASRFGAGAVLFQYDDQGRELVVCYASRKFLPAETRWSTFQQEASTVVWALERFTEFTQGYNVIVECDHRNISFVKRSSMPQLARWRMRLQDHDFSIRFLQGCQNLVSDGLSRIHADDVEVTLADALPECSLLYARPSDTVDYAAVAALACAPYNAKLCPISTRPKSSDKANRSAATAAAIPSDDSDDDSSSDESSSDDETEATRPRFGPRGEVLPADGIADVADQIIPPNVDVPLIAKDEIKSVHNDLVGHKGVYVTLQRLLRNGRSWGSRAQMLADVDNFLSGCPTCQKMRKRKSHCVVDRRTISGSPFAELSIDVLKLPKPDARGNKYCIVIVDSFSRWTSLTAVANKSAFDAARALLNFIGNFGAPLRIRSDGGGEFVNGVIVGLTKMMGISQHVVQAYTPTANGIVERANRAILEHLRELVFCQRLKFHSHHQWGDLLPLVQRTLNASIHLPIGTSPSSILFGDSLDLDRAILTRIPKMASFDVDNYVDVLSANQRIIIEKADELQSLACDKVIAKSLASQRVKRNGRWVSLPIKPLAVDDWVLAKPQPDYPLHKLAPRWLGPFRVVNVSDSSDIVSVYDTVKLTIRKFLKRQLEPFNVDQITDVTGLTSVAEKDNFEFPVDFIMGHALINEHGVGNDPVQLDRSFVRGNRRKSSFQFLIKWSGYEEPSWIAFKDAKRLVQFPGYVSVFSGLNML
jgi:hypothetical protein